MQKPSCSHSAGGSRSSRRVAVKLHRLLARQITGLQAALGPQVADLGAKTWHLVGTRPSVTVRLQGPILYMVSATGLNRVI